MWRSETGEDLTAPAACSKLIDDFADKVEELVDRSRGRVRADVVHDKLVAMGFRGTERTTRRAVRKAKQAWSQGKRRTYRALDPGAGLWMQADWGAAPW